MIVDLAHLDRMARELRGLIIEMTHQAKPAHLASALSCVDIVTVLYWTILKIDPARPLAPERDRFILSKGHAALTLYAALTKRGFCSAEDLRTFNTNGGRLAEHPGLQCLPGVEAATGSLGHGLPLAVGMSLAARLGNQPSRVFALMSDGECNEGSVWEAAMFAAGQKLGNLCAIIDFNKWQATGRSQEVLQLDPLPEKWASFGWDTVRLDGHDHRALHECLSHHGTGRKRPLAIIADTVKGKGVSFMEDDNNWHYRVPTADEVTAAKKELGLA
ncbi:transketolase [Dongia sp.]|uniref:transketolase n=1 Tax=Dongia sp. TaxID=1977262 RepID=UPI0035B279F1